jgi:NAD(P)-dependent dehydrogenase (short-subunit alcohol dehydrogenase family)
MRGVMSERILAGRLDQKYQGNQPWFLCFGMMPTETAVEQDFALARSTIESYYLGAVSFLSHFAPILEAQRGGHIVILGSVAGDRGSPHKLPVRLD